MSYERHSGTGSGTLCHFDGTQNATHLRIHLVPDDYGLWSRRALATGPAVV
jgi:predicted CxxxxCH...CXXCH cytochrome family protein